VYKKDYFAQDLFDQGISSMYRTGKKGTTIGQLINLHIESSEEVCALEFARDKEVVGDDDADVLYVEQFASLGIILLCSLLFSIAGTIVSKMYKKKKATRREYEKKKMSLVTTREFQNMVKRSIESVVYPKLNSIIQKMDDDLNDNEDNTRWKSTMNPLRSRKSVTKH
jgi:hypothetical protein